MATPAIAAGPVAAAERRDCGCGDLESVEREIKEQEYLHQLLSDWAVYMPGSILTTEDIRTRANAQFYLTFYGVPLEAPLKTQTGTGAGAAFGTLVEEDGCPLVEYLYDERGKPVMVESRESQTQHRVPPELVQAWQLTTEAQYKSSECAALVHYGFVHELHHQKKCRDKNTPKAEWKKLRFFAEQDRDAYAAGLDVLYAERDRLKAKCRIKPVRDGRWHGTIEYAYTFNDVSSERVEKGKDKVYLNGEGTKERLDRKSARVSAVIDAPAEGGRFQAAYNGSRQEGWFNKSTFVMPAECGSFRKTTWMLDHGVETRTEGSTSGTVDATLRVDGDAIAVSFRVPDMHDGTFTRREWDKPQGYCQEKNNRPVVNGTGHIQTVQGFSVSMKVEIDPEHPNDIDVVRIVPDSGGKGQYYYALKLHREPVEPQR